MKMVMENMAKERVRKNTSWRQNVKIDNNPGKIFNNTPKVLKKRFQKRIRTLNNKWDMERTLEQNMATLALTGLTLSVFVDKRWAILSGVVLGFFVQHAIQGWCPPLPALRAMKVRTRTEIDEEKFALKALRGDFNSIKSAEEALLAIKKV